MRILDQDPGLRLDEPPSGPAMLPADIGSFTGREDELEALGELTAVGSSLAAITGPGGSGKTALAVHWGHSRRPDFPDGQLYVNLRGFDRGAAVSAVDALERLLTAFGVAGRRDSVRCGRCHDAVPEPDRRPPPPRRPGQRPRRRPGPAPPAGQRQPRPTSDQAALVSLDRGMVHLCRGEHEPAAGRRPKPSAYTLLCSRRSFPPTKRAPASAASLEG